MTKAKFGVFVHYLVSGDDFNEKVDSFNVEKFADQIEQTRADYVIFTLGQDSGYFCSPNAVYDRYAAFTSGRRTSRRDLPMEIADQLRQRNIRLILYSTSRSPHASPELVKHFADLEDTYKTPATQEFTRRWSEVLREWSLRYGHKVSGWWFDGAYNTAGWDDPDQPYNWNTWAAACRAGNPDSVLAFNKGANIEKAFQQLTNQQDFTAGEQRRLGATPDRCPPYPNVHWHILSYLGDRWAHPSGPNYRDDWLIDYVKKVNRQGGMVSLEVNVNWEGTIYPPHLRQLKALGDALHNIMENVGWKCRLNASSGKIRK